MPPLQVCLLLHLGAALAPPRLTFEATSAISAFGNILNLIAPSFHSMFTEACGNPPPDLSLLPRHHSNDRDGVSEEGDA